jgi:hypothetical protein
MPKILINEENNTSAGTPGRYGNYTILLAGYKGTPVADETKWQKPDENGVYEFNSAQAFKDTIGEAEIALKNDAGSVVEYHYGNKMAYELLKLGYPVIYRVIDSIDDMADESFWEIFKDKANYDFRFVSHGLLETCADTDAYLSLLAKRSAMLADLQILKEIEIACGLGDNHDVFDVNEVATCDAQFALVADKGNFASTEVYAVRYNYYHTAAGLSETEGGKKDPNSGIASELADVEKDIAALDEVAFTVGKYNKINGNIARLASYRVGQNEGRGDCTALIELDENAYVVANSKDRPETLIINGINVMSTDIGEEGKYCALTVPSIYYANGMKMPGAFHYLACFMRTLNAGFAEWYAAAGYNRGISSYAIDHTSVKLGEIAINALEPRYLVQDPAKAQPVFACNVIANFRGSYYLWGNRTAAKLLEEAGGGDLTAEHFLNIRQLCTTIKKQLYTACRRFTFDPNSDTLWFNFVNAITPTLDAMKADQGIRDYKVVKVSTDKKATLKARIRVIPIEAVEDFDITVSLEDSFGGVSVTAEG